MSGTSRGDAYGVLFVLGFFAVLTVSLLMITQSTYLVAYSYPFVYLILLAVFIGSKVASVLGGAGSWGVYYLLVPAALIILAAYLLDGDDHETNRLGVWVLIGMHVIDLIYTIWSGNQQKKAEAAAAAPDEKSDPQMTKVAYWGSLISDIGVIALLGYSLV